MQLYFCGRLRVALAVTRSLVETRRLSTLWLYGAWSRVFISLKHRVQRNEARETSTGFCTLSFISQHVLQGC